jgi:hypothetical protein
LSIHPNPDGSDSDGVKVEPPGTFIAHAFVSPLTSSTALTGVAAAATKGANIASIQAQGEPVFYRLDGVAPTVSVGVEIPAGSSVALNMSDAANALFISTAGGLLAVTFTM